MSGALYESMFVVEMSSTGAEILCLMVPDEKECFVVRFLRGMSDKLSDTFADLLVVKALERDIFAEYGRIVTFGPDKLDIGSSSSFHQRDRWLLTTVDYGGVKLSESVIGADKLGRCAFRLRGIGRWIEMCCKTNVLSVAVVHGPGMWLCVDSTLRPGDC
jgi:hypothetical protein